MGQRMVRLEYYDPGRDGHHGGLAGPGGPAVAIQTVPEGDPTERSQTWTGDLAIVTIPFSSPAVHATVTPPFSYKKRRAVIETHYDPATKVLLEFSRRWWEFTEEDWQRELDAIAPGPVRVLPAAAARQDAEAALAVPPSLRDLPTGCSAPIRAWTRSASARSRRQYYSNSAAARRAVRPATHCLRRRLRHRQPQPLHVLPLPPRPRQHRAAWCSPATPGRTTPRAGTPSRTHERYGYALRNLQSVHGRRIEVFYTGRGADPELAARPVRLRRGRRLHPAPDDQLPPRCGAGPRARCTSPVSISRSSTPGSRARWRRPYAPPSPSTRPRGGRERRRRAGRGAPRAPGGRQSSDRHERVLTS